MFEGSCVTEIGVYIEPQADWYWNRITPSTDRTTFHLKDLTRFKVAYVLRAAATTILLSIIVYFHRYAPHIFHAKFSSGIYTRFIAILCNWRAIIKFNINIWCLKFRQKCRDTSFSMIPTSRDKGNRYLYSYILYSSLQY